MPANWPFWSSRGQRVRFENPLRHIIVEFPERLFWSAALGRWCEGLFPPIIGKRCATREEELLF